MKAEPIFQDLEAVKGRLVAGANGDTGRFLDQMEAWLAEHPPAGPVVDSPPERRRDSGRARLQTAATKGHAIAKGGPRRWR